MEVNPDKPSSRGTSPNGATGTRIWSRPAAPDLQEAKDTGRGGQGEQPPSDNAEVLATYTGQETERTVKRKEEENTTEVIRGRTL